VKRYITTTLPYVNSAPHIGFALEIVQADALARAWRMAGDLVYFNTGTDEHGVKIHRKALEVGQEPQTYVDSAVLNFKDLMSALNISEHTFIRTTDSHHVAAAQEFWRRCAAAGDIEKKVYRTKYCAGCELEKTDSELVDGKCPLHPTLTIEEREEENYFFKFSKYSSALLDLYRKYPDFVMPTHRLTEIQNFVSSGLADFSISRLKEKMPWGVPVPGDPDHVMYVWFDALVNYVSTLGWPENTGKFGEFWGTKEKPNAVQVAGKDNLRQQSAMWQAMLISAGLPASRQIFIHGFITSGGQKMSKSTGNVIDPFALVAKYGADALRYYLLREIPAAEDGDFSEDKFRERYNADLANGIGNFAARVTTLAAGVGEFSAGMKPDTAITEHIERTKEAMNTRLSQYRFHEVLAALWELISFGDARVNDTKPWAMEDGAEKKQTLLDLVVLLDNIAALLAPFLPEAAGKITACLTWEGKTLRVKKSDILFPRLA
jgi:methionyl-tRNA synthetase